MENVILETLRKGNDVHEFTSEIAELMTAFIKWKDNNWIDYNKIEKFYAYHYSFSGFYHFKTIEELFTYWHTEIYKKQK